MNVNVSNLYVCKRSCACGVYTIFVAVAIAITVVVYYLYCYRILFSAQIQFCRMYCVRACVCSEYAFAHISSSLRMRCTVAYVDLSIKHSNKIEGHILLLGKIMKNDRNRAVVFDWNCFALNKKKLLN